MLGHQALKTTCKRCSTVEGDHDCTNAGSRHLAEKLRAGDEKSGQKIAFLPAALIF